MKFFPPSSSLFPISYFLLPLFLSASAAPVLIGETSRAQDSVFAPSDKVQLLFRVTGMAPKQADLVLKVAVVDDYGKTVKNFDQKLLADTNGMDEVRIEYLLPCGTPAFYRVKAELSDGVKLKTAWSDLPEGEMTYCILPEGAAGVKPLPEAAALKPFREMLAAIPGGVAGGTPRYDLSKGRPKPAAVKRTAPKEAYPVLQALASFLENRVFVGEVKTFGEKVRAYSYREKASGRTALVLWAPDATPGKPVSVDVPVKAENGEATIINRFGAVRKAKVQKALNVQLADRPVYVLNIME